MSGGYDAVLFDFDGVLADTEPLHWRCWAEILAPLGITLTWAQYAAEFIGAADEDILSRFATLAPSPPAMSTMRDRYESKQVLFRHRALAEKVIPAETVDLLRSLTAYPLAVVTSSGSREVEPMLQAADVLSLLETAVYGEDVERHKPAPEPYLLAAARLAANRPVVVEDSDAGVASAKAAGFDVIRVASPADVPRLVTSYLQSR